MSAVVQIDGTIRIVKPVTKRATGEVFGNSVSVLTESHGVLGETLEVVVFNPRPGEQPVRAEVGDHVSWVVEVESSNFGLRATFKQALAPAQPIPSAPAPGGDPWLSGAHAADPAA